MQEYEGMEHARAMRAFAERLAGGTDITGLEMMRLVRVIANQYDTIINEELRGAELSGPRLGLLLRLLAEEEIHGLASVSPTHLSHWQNVSKNTISTLLRGLEEQGLIERTLDPDDLRGFRISISQAGRELVRARLPDYLARLNALLSGLTQDEWQQLMGLLRQLHHSLLVGGDSPDESVPEISAEMMAEDQAVGGK